MAGRPAIVLGNAGASLRSIYLVPLARKVKRMAELPPWQHPRARPSRASTDCARRCGCSITATRRWRSASSSRSSSSTSRSSPSSSSRRCGRTGRASSGSTTPCAAILLADIVARALATTNLGALAQAADDHRRHPDPRDAARADRGSPTSASSACCGCGRCRGAASSGGRCASAGCASGRRRHARSINLLTFIFVVTGFVYIFFARRRRAASRAMSMRSTSRSPA